MTAGPVLVGDIGGTHARFGLVERPGERPRAVRVLACADYPGLGAAIEAYLAGHEPRPGRAALAVAGPVTDNQCHFTNLPWIVSGTQLAADFGFEAVLLVNDLAALARAVPGLGSSEVLPIADRRGMAGEPILVIGVGTGLGAATLVPGLDPQHPPGSWRVLASEAGHMGLAPLDHPEPPALVQLRQSLGPRLIIDMVLSGPGLYRLGQALAVSEGLAMPAADTPALIATGLAEPAGGLCRRTLLLFLELLGAVAGDLALAAGARGGVMIGGGLVPRLRPLLAPSRLHARFLDKGVMAAFLEPVPIGLILSDDAALAGAAALLGDMRAAG